jgi:hypothetical protein
MSDMSTYAFSLELGRSFGHGLPSHNMLVCYRKLGAKHRKLTPISLPVHFFSNQAKYRY